MYFYYSFMQALCYKLIFYFPKNLQYLFASTAINTTVRVMCRNFFPWLSCPHFFFVVVVFVSWRSGSKFLLIFFQPAWALFWAGVCLCELAYVLFFLLFFYVQREFCRRRRNRRCCRCLCIFSDCDRFFFLRPLYMLCRCAGVCVCECFCSFAFAFANRWRCRRLLASFFLFVIRFIIIVHRSVACM